MCRASIVDAAMRVGQFDELERLHPDPSSRTRVAMANPSNHSGDAKDSSFLISLCSTGVSRDKLACNVLRAEITCCSRDSSSMGSWPPASPEAKRRHQTTTAAAAAAAPTTGHRASRIVGVFGRPLADRRNGSRTEVQLGVIEEKRADRRVGTPEDSS